MTAPHLKLYPLTATGTPIKLSWAPFFALTMIAVLTPNAAQEMSAAIEMMTVLT
jgi:hypothetical protein